MIVVETLNNARRRYGSETKLTGAQIRWALANTRIPPERLRTLGFHDLSDRDLQECAGKTRDRILRWTGSRWETATDWIDVDEGFLRQTSERLLSWNGGKPTTRTQLRTGCRTTT